MKISRTFNLELTEEEIDAIISALDYGIIVDSNKNKGLMTDLQKQLEESRNGE